MGISKEFEVSGNFSTVKPGGKISRHEEVADIHGYLKLALLGTSLIAFLVT